MDDGCSKISKIWNFHKRQKISSIFRNSLHRKCKPIDDRCLEI